MPVGVGAPKRGTNHAGGLFIPQAQRRVPINHGKPEEEKPSSSGQGPVRRGRVTRRGVLWLDSEEGVLARLDHTGEANGHSKTVIRERPGPASLERSTAAGPEVRCPGPARTGTAIAGGRSSERGATRPRGATGGRGAARGVSRLLYGGPHGQPPVERKEHTAQSWAPALQPEKPAQALATAHTARWPHLDGAAHAPRFPPWPAVRVGASAPR
mgnify:CR=1 FL=1